MITAILSVSGMLLPDAALIAIGAFIGGRLESSVWAGIDKLNFMLLFPALLFTSAASRSIAWSQIASLGLATWSLMFVGLVLAFFLRRLGPERFVDFAGAWQTAWRFNTGIAFVAVQALPPTTAALMSITIGLAVPIANVFAVTALSHGTDGGWNKTLRAITTNPFLLASLAGVAVAMSDIHLPEAPMHTLDKLSGAAVPLALLSIGATLDWRALLRLNLFTGGLNVIKLVILPITAIGVAYVFALNAPAASVLIVFAALPTASAAHILAGAFGADRVLPSTIIAQSTLLACLTLPIWITISGEVQRFGF
jgi:predicted permease